MSLLSGNQPLTMKRSALATKIFSSFKDKKLLAFIADSRNLQFDAEEVDVIALLSEYSFQQGLSKALNGLSKPLVLEMLEKAGLKPDQSPITPVAVSILIEEMKRIGIADVLEKIGIDLLRRVLNRLEIQIDEGEASMRRLVRLFIDHSERFGVEFIFSAFSPDRLIEFMKSCKLEADSRSVPILIDCLITQTSYTREKSESSEVKLSSKKPPIDENISKVDLNSWFNIEDLRDWLKEQGLQFNGTKKHLIDRIFAYYGRSESGKPLSGKMKEKRQALARPSRALKKARLENSQDVSEGQTTQVDVPENAEPQPPPQVEELAKEEIIEENAPSNIAAQEDALPPAPSHEFSYEPFDEIPEGFQFSTLTDFAL